MLTAVCPCCGSVVDKDQLMDEIEVADVVDRLGFQHQPAILFLMLFKANGRTLTKTTLIDLVEAIKPDRLLSDYALRSTIVRIKKRLENYPVRIAVVSGIGYRMERQDTKWHWRNLPLLATPSLGDRDT